jgi:hypothetical protein
MVMVMVWQTISVQRNTEARSRNHCCRGEAISISIYLCVCVCVCVRARERESAQERGLAHGCPICRRCLGVLGHRTSTLIWRVTLEMWRCAVNVATTRHLALSMWINWNSIFILAYVNIRRGLKNFVKWGRSKSLGRVHCDLMEISLH